MSSSVNRRATPDLPHSFGHFDRLTQFKLDAPEVVVSKWRSRATGLNLVHIDYEDLLVRGYFAVPTEAFNNQAFACSWALGHLVLTGSEKYPYNTALDKIAGRCFAKGIDVSLGTDHIAHEVQTAGGEGFCQILPVCIDHILYPTLTEAAFITQIHHVNGKGEDAGVLYNILDAENLPYKILTDRLGQMQHPDGSGSSNHFRALRDVVRALTLEEVRQYHSTHYVPHNLCLIVIGFAEGTRSLLQILQDQVEPNIISHGQGRSPFHPDWKRPSPRRPISLEKIESGVMRDTITVPEMDGRRGCLLVHLTTSPRNPLEFTAFSTFHNYWKPEKKDTESLLSYVVSLKDSMTRQKTTVHTRNEFCLQSRSCASAKGMSIYFFGVPEGRLGVLDEVCMDRFKRIAADGIDMGRMSTIIDVAVQEASDHCKAKFSDGVINDFLFGPEDGSDLEAELNLLKHYTVLKNWSSKEWMDHLKKYYLDAPRIVICGEPSKDMASNAEKAEIDRLVTQVQKLGTEGLKRAATCLREAIQEIEKPVPDAVLTGFPIPNTSHMRWETVRSVQEPGIGRRATVEDADPTIQEHLASDGEELPFFVQYDHVQSTLATVSMVLTLNRVPDHLRGYLAIYTQALFSLPIKERTGEYPSVLAPTGRTAQFKCDFGLFDIATNTLCIDVTAELSHYEAAVSWLRDFMYSTEFTREALQDAIATRYNSLATPPRTVSDMLNAETVELAYSNDSIAWVFGRKRDLALTRALRTQIEENPSMVIATFEEIRRCRYVFDFTHPSSVRFSVKGDILSIEQPRSVWRRHFGDVLPTSNLDPVLQRSSRDEFGKKAVIIPAFSDDEIHARFTAKGPQRVDDPSSPALTLAAEMLNAEGGYLERYTGGHGRASVQSGAGLVSLSLSGCSLAQVFEEAANAIKSLADGLLEIDNTALETAKSRVVHHTVVLSRKLSDAVSKPPVTVPEGASWQHTTWHRD